MVPDWALVLFGGTVRPVPGRSEVCLAVLGDLVLFNATTGVVGVVGAVRAHLSALLHRKAANPGEDIDEAARPLVVSSAGVGVDEGSRGEQRWVEGWACKGG